MFSCHLLAKLVLSLSCCLLVVGQAPDDPIRDLCRRFSHQTAVLDNRLYIDGGYVNANPLSQNPRAVINEGLFYDDLTVVENTMPKLYGNASKNTTIPDVAGGILWADSVNKAFYLFGGEFSDVPQSFALWSYDAVLDIWNVSNAVGDIERVSFGAGVSVDDRGEGWYYGGYLGNRSVPTWGNSPSIATNGLVHYDMTENEWTNSSGPDDIGRAEGVMVHLPISRSGALIYFGGVQFPNGAEEPLDMSIIYIYELAEGKWYIQNATGDVPPPRRKFCAGSTWAQDRSSYNVYLYGGFGFGENSTGFDDVYILTMPGFVWIKWWPVEPGPGNPHGSLSCNVINNAQMLIIGGIFPESDQCDAPEVQATHNLNLGKTNSSGAMWAPFQPNLTDYYVPSEIIDVVGGQASGGATLTAPRAGWGNRDLAVYFTQQASVAARSPTRSIPTSTSVPQNDGGGLSKGGIIGAAVGGAVGFLLFILVVILFCILHRQKRRKEQKPTEAQMRETQPPSELPERNSTYKSHTSGDSALGQETSSPGLKYGISDATGHSSHPSSSPPPTLAPPPLFASVPSEHGQQPLWQQHPAHETARHHYPRPQHAHDMSPASPQSQSYQSYSTYPTSISTTPANLYGYPPEKSYAARESSRQHMLPAEFAGSVELSASPHSQESSYSAASGHSYGYAGTEIKSPRPRPGTLGQSPTAQHRQYGPGAPPVYTGELSGRAVSYELPTIRSPVRAREMGVNSRTGEHGNARDGAVARENDEEGHYSYSGER